MPLFQVAFWYECRMHIHEHLHITQTYKRNFYLHTAMHAYLTPKHFLWLKFLIVHLAEDASYWSAHHKMTGLTTSDNTSVKERRYCNDWWNLGLLLWSWGKSNGKAEVVSLFLASFFYIFFICSFLWSLFLIVLMRREAFHFLIEH